MAQTADTAKPERQTDRTCGNCHSLDKIGHITHIEIHARKEVGCSRKLGTLVRPLGQHSQTRIYIRKHTVTLDTVLGHALEGDPAGGKGGDLIPERGGTPVALNPGGRASIVTRGHTYPVTLHLDCDTAVAHHGDCHLYIWHRDRIACQLQSQRPRHRRRHHQHRRHKLRAKRRIYRDLATGETFAADLKRRIAFGADILDFSAEPSQGVD